jgi:hypothetical protein
LPDYKITWPNIEQKEADFKLFYQACQMIIQTLHLDDVNFAKDTVPKIFTILESSTIFSHLKIKKKSETQGNTIEHHVRTVPKCLTTDSKNLEERFILRATAVFHDFGKAFDIGRDQVHYHALISSNIFSWFMEEYKDKLIQEMMLKNIFNDSISHTSNDEESEFIDNQEIKKTQFDKIRNQISESIRLHHVLEKLEKGVLDFQTIAEIFRRSDMQLATFGLFVIADGVSVVPSEAIYALFLVQNINYYFKLFDEIFHNNDISDDEELGRMKQMYAAVLVNSLEKIIKESKIDGLYDKVAIKINGIKNQLDETLQRSLQHFITK